jgi:nucleotide-binding universal stress UspA family protein
MRSTNRAPRVVVGVSDSLTGLRALREAVAAARAGGFELLAVRAYPPPGTDVIYVGPGDMVRPPTDPDLPPAPDSPRSDRERAARATIRRAFAMAMGGPPDDVEVKMCAREGFAGHVLVNVAYDERDMLVVGTTRRRRWFRRSVSKYVARRSGCPVLVVPPTAAAHELDTRSLLGRRALRRAVPDDLSELTSESVR